MAAYSIRKTLVASLCLAAFSSTSWAASPLQLAGEERMPVNFEYKFDSRELATNQGAKRVYLGLVRKARRACTFPGDLLQNLKNVDSQCTASLVNNVLREADSVALFQQHQNFQQQQQQTTPQRLAAVP